LVVARSVANVSQNEFVSVPRFHYLLHPYDTSLVTCCDIEGRPNSIIVGIRTCWLNRGGDSWHHDIKPDYTVRTLLQAAYLLGVRVNKIA